MNVRKTINKIASVGVTASLMVGTTMMGAFAASSTADLADLPAPFVDGGVADFQIVLGEGAAVNDVLGAVDIATAFQADSVSEVEISTGSGTTTTVEGGYLLEGVGGGDYLVFGESAAETIDDAELPGLLDTKTLKDKDGDDGDVDLNSFVEEESDFDQELTFGAFNVTFGNPESIDDPVVYVDIGAEDFTGITYNLTLDFDDAIDFTAMDDNEVINIGGREFTVAESGTTSSNLKLFGSDSTVFVQLNSPKTVEVDGQTIELEVVGGNSDANSGDGSVVLSVNGERETLTEGETETFTGDIEVFVRDLFVTNIPTLDASATLFIGSEEIDIQHNQRIEINNEDLDIYETEVLNASGGNTFDTAEQLGFLFTASDFDDDDMRYLEAGDSIVDPFFGTFELNFVGSSQELMDDAKVPFKLDASSSELNVLFVNDDNDEITFELFERTGRDSAFGEDFVVGQSTPMTLLTEDSLFLGQDGDTTSLFEVIDVDDADAEVQIKNHGTGTTFTVSNGSAIDDTQYTLDMNTTDSFGVGTAGPQNYFELKGGAVVSIQNASVVSFAEEASDFEDHTGSAANVTVTVGYDSSDDDYEMSFSASANGFQTATYDNDDQGALSPYGTFFIIDDDGLTFDLYTPDENEVEYHLFVQPTDAAVITTGGSGSAVSQSVNAIAPGLAVLDSDISLASASRNLIVVGGPAVNSVAYELLGSPEDRTAGFEPGKATIELFDLANGKVAMLVAGWEALETQAASRAVATQDDRLEGDSATLTVTSLNSYSIATQE